MVDAPPSHRRAALFVDFDNIFLGLQNLDPEAAESFARDPGAWVRSVPDIEGDGRPRRFLVRNCYVNARGFTRYRAHWTSAGFKVIDCPSMTRQHKSSADITLALDVVDVLGGEVKIDEFLIASADSDFTPLVQRIRAADRVTTVILAGGAASAYREMADHVMEVNDLIEVLASNEMEQTPSVRTMGAGQLDSSTETARVASEVNAVSGPASTAFEAIVEIVREAPAPVLMSALGTRARMADPHISDDWEGFRSFGSWLRQSPKRIAADGFYAWDPERFTGDELRIRADDRTDLQRRVGQVTDVPRLSQSQYGRLLTVLAEVVDETPFNRTATSSAVRDRCADGESGIGRNAVNSVINALQRDNQGISEGITASSYAARWATQAEALCELAQMELDATEREELRAWVGGGLVSR